MQAGAWGKGGGDELGAEEERVGYGRPLGVASRWAAAAAAAAAAAKSFQSCPTLCDPIDGSPPGPAVPGVL